MPVWVSTDPKDDVKQGSKQRRHISSDCPTYLANVPQAHRAPAKGRPNTERLQERTVRCEHPACWTKREQEDAQRPRRGKGGTTTASKAAAAPTQRVGGKAQTLAERAKAGREKQKQAAAA